MITENQLKETWAGSHLTDRMQNRHYIECCALFVLDDYPFVFRGGTCLWFFYGLPRFSEDLDFTPTIRYDPRTFPEEFITEVHDRLQDRLGIENNLEYRGFYQKQTFSFVVNAKGPYFHPTRRWNGFEAVDIHVSYKDRAVIEPIPMVLSHEGYDIPRMIVSCMDQHEVVAEKTEAIFGREKPRDVFDLWYMITRYDIPFDMSLINIKLAKKKFVYTIKKFAERVEAKRALWDDIYHIVLLRKKQRPSFDLCKETILEWASRSKSGNACG